MLLPIASVACVCSRTLGLSEDSWQSSDTVPLSIGWRSLNLFQQAVALQMGYEGADFYEESAASTAGEEGQASKARQ